MANLLHTVPIAFRCGTQYNAAREVGQNQREMEEYKYIYLFLYDAAHKKYGRPIISTDVYENVDIGTCVFCLHNKVETQPKETGRSSPSRFELPLCLRSLIMRILH